MKRTAIRLVRRAALCTAALFSASAAQAAADTCKLGVFADLPVTMEGRRAAVPVTVNGHQTSFWLDSGAFYNIMSQAKALELGLTLKDIPRAGFRLMGIGGSQEARYTTIRSFGIVGATLDNIDFIVGGSDVGNGLLGRNLLGLRDTEFDLAHGSVKLVKPEGCEGNLAYWAGEQTVFTVALRPEPGPADNGFRMPVSINDAEITAEFDTGSPSSLLSRRAAERAGIDLTAPGVTAVDRIGGFGQRVLKGWIVPVRSVSVGNETILSTRIRVIDGPITAGDNSPDMLLGMDFMLAHRIYVARGQHRIYFTYAGGNPFLSAAPPGGAAAPGTPAPAPEIPAGSQRVAAPTDAGTPTTVDAFAQRGNVRLSQHDVTGAIADYTQAIALAPDRADLYRSRAGAYSRNGQGNLAHADVEKALSLDPHDGDLLRARAANRLRQNDPVGALADAEAAVVVTPPTSLDAAANASLFTGLGKPDRAIAMLDTVIAAHRSDSRLGSLLNARCWARAMAGTDLARAVDDCTTAIRRDGAKPAYLDSRGTAWFRLGNMQKALADFDAAITAEPRQANSLYMRSLVQARLGDADKARTDREAALAIAPWIADRLKSFGINE